jgi:hypothetical protein
VNFGVGFGSQECLKYPFGAYSVASKREFETPGLFTIKIVHKSKKINLKAKSWKKKQEKLK